MVQCTSNSWAEKMSDELTQHSRNKHISSPNSQILFWKCLSCNAISSSKCLIQSLDKQIVYISYICCHRLSWTIRTSVKSCYIAIIVLIRYFPQTRSWLSNGRRTTIPRARQGFQQHSSNTLFKAVLQAWSMPQVPVT